ncbi:MAG: hypothetical protein ABI592_04440 [Acidobacteriota bacterium]
MFHLPPILRRAAVAAALLLALPLGAQTLFVGDPGPPQGPLPAGDPPLPFAVRTYVQLGYGANVNGTATSATFSWAAAPCPAAVKIKFFRPSSALPGGVYFFVAERGPFDVTQARQTVRLDPPVALVAGDVIAITNLTSCGGPVLAGDPATPTNPLPSPGPYFRIDGDITTTFVPTGIVPGGPGISLLATDNSLTLLGRFNLTLLATNPRNGATTVGSPVTLSSDAGYFSLPDFTGRAGFPEVVVKMVDATHSPELGGDFWVFHSPLTDVGYTLIVTDQIKGTSRSYANAPSAPGQLCGGVDTSAFTP